MKDIADRNTIMGAYEWALRDPDTNFPFGQSVNVVVVRAVFQTGTTQPSSTSCSVCDCLLTKATATVNVPSDEQLYADDAKFPASLPRRVEFPMPSGTPDLSYKPSKSRKTRRLAEPEALDDEDTSYSTAHQLFKRTNYQTCRVRYSNDNYPSTAKSTRLPAGPGSADAVPQIVKWVDWQAFTAANRSKYP